jgi:hypothetical protein
MSEKPSSEWYSTPNVRRKAKVRGYCLRDETVEKLQAIADELGAVSMSEAVTMIVDKAYALQQPCTSLYELEGPDADA